MEYPDSIKDISSRVKKTVQSLYTLIKKNQGFINDNSQKQGRNVKYNQAVMDWFINYYGVSQEEEAAQDTSKTPQISPETASTISGEEKSLIEAKARIAVLEAENKALLSRIAWLEEELHQVNQNVNIALLNLQQEKAEKLRLLPPARKSFTEVVKGIFAKKNQESHQESQEN